MASILLVSGSRTWTRTDWIKDELLNWMGRRMRPWVLFEGEAKGADVLAKKEAKALGWLVVPFEPDYRRYSPSEAPLRRNDLMVERLLAAAGNGHSIGMVAFQHAHSWGTEYTIRRHNERHANPPARVIYDCECHGRFGEPVLLTG